MAAFQLILCIILVTINAEKLYWYKKEYGLPYPLHSAVCGTNRNHNLIYIIGGYTYEERNDSLTPIPSPYIYQYNGSKFTILSNVSTYSRYLQSNTPINTALQYYTSIDDIIYMMSYNYRLWSFNMTSHKFDTNYASYASYKAIETEFSCMASNTSFTVSCRSMGSI